MGVRFRKDRGKWICDTVVSGKRVAKMFDTQVDACEYEASLKKSLNPEVVGADNSFKLAVKHYVNAVSVTKRSYKKEKYFFTHLFKYLQDKRVSRLEDITFDHLQGFQVLVLSRGVKKSTSNRYFTVFKHFFKHCVTMGWIKDSPVRHIQMFPENKKIITRKIWTDAQINQAIANSDGWLRDFIVAISHTGMRPVEVTRMRWDEHVDFTKCTIKAVTYKGKGQELQRLIPMTKDLRLMLMKRKMATLSEWVFPNTTNRGAKTVDAVGQQLKDLTKKIGLVGYTFYGMRHSFATRCMENGLGTEDIMQLMGHEKYETTRVYLRYTEGHLRSAMELMEKKRNLVASESATIVQPD